MCSVPWNQILASVSALIIKQKDKGPLVIRPRKEAQEGGPEGKTRNIRSAGPDVNLVGIGPETQSHYLRTGRAADLGYAQIGRAHV